MYVLYIARLCIWTKCLLDNIPKGIVTRHVRFKYCHVYIVLDGNLPCTLVTSILQIYMIINVGKK